MNLSNLRAAMLGLALSGTLGLTACGTPAPIEQHELAAHCGSALDGKRVALALRYRQRVWTDGKTHLIGTQAGPGEYELRDYDFERELVDNALVVEFERVMNTRGQLQLLRPRLVEAIESSCATFVEQPDQADLLLSATIEFGPTPAPAYADHQLARSAVSRVLTLGLAPDSYQLRGDYRLELSLGAPYSTQAWVAHEYITEESQDFSASRFNLNLNRNNGTAATELFDQLLKRDISDFLERIPHGNQ